MRHLSSEERLAIIEAAGEPGHSHLAVCDRCRDDVATARAVVHAARGVEVPEPSPLFWDHFSGRVSEAIAAPARPPARRWAHWRVLVPVLVGVAALVVAVVIDRGPATRRVAPLITVPVADSGEPAGATAEDEQWRALSGLAGDFDLETLSDSLGTSGAGHAERAVWQLNERERAELAALLQAELRLRKSGN
jgi:hypothetical protein